MISIPCRSLVEIDDVAGRIIEFCGHVRVVAFYGDIGAGKTTLIRAICRNLGVTDQVTSPTFPIINEYSATNLKKLYHFDFYRIKDELSLMDLGLEEYFSSGNYCFIEWPALAEKHLPSVFVQVVVLSKDDHPIEPGSDRKRPRIFRLEIISKH